MEQMTSGGEKKYFSSAGWKHRQHLQLLRSVRSNAQTTCRGKQNHRCGYFHGPCAVLTGTWAGWRSRGFGSVVNAKAKVKGPLAERLLRPRSNALPTFHSSSMVTHHSGGRNAAIFLKERFVRGRTIW